MLFRSNNAGQLGDGTVTSKSSPVQIGSSSWTFVSARYNTNNNGGHTIAKRYAANDLWMAGHSIFNNLVDTSSFVQVGSGYFNNDALTTITGSLYANMGLTATGTLYMWGVAGDSYGAYGTSAPNLAIYNYGNYYSSPVQIGTGT